MKLIAHIFVTVIGFTGGVLAFLGGLRGFQIANVPGWATSPPVAMVGALLLCFAGLLMVYSTTQIALAKK